jgi:hypothetical protein
MKNLEQYIEEQKAIHAEEASYYFRISQPAWQRDHSNPAVPISNFTPQQLRLLAAIAYTMVQSCATLPLVVTMDEAESVCVVDAPENDDSRS